MPYVTTVQDDEVMTATLHIEHEITDYATWKEAFDRFADARSHAGVTDHRIRLDDDDDRQIVIDLGFDSTARAHAFPAFLLDSVWGTSNSPALASTPTTRILVRPGDDN